MLLVNIASYDYRSRTNHRIEKAMGYLQTVGRCGDGSFEKSSNSLWAAANSLAQRDDMYIQPVAAWAWPNTLYIRF